jgi:hypothetical protein
MSFLGVIMVNDKKGEEKEKGFIVKDKRFSAQKEEEGSQIKEEAKREATKEDVSEQGTSLPEINFSSLILSLSTSALIQLGEIQDPTNKQVTKNLPLAKQTIDLIGMLREKTKGNLTPEEEKFLETILFDLRMRYVKANG